ncbi:MAG: DUF4116 domain-containing protein [Gallionellaceae bacterium]|nr:DUF4116 domain-containing protein [Gallionellaceae bacterium]
MKYTEEQINEIKYLLKNKYWFHSYLGENIKADKDLMRICLMLHPNTLAFCSDEMQDNEAIVKQAIAMNYDQLSNASPRLKDNEDIIFFAFDCEEQTKPNFNDTLSYASPRLQDKESIVLRALSIDNYSFRYASQRIQELIKTYDPELKDPYNTLKTIIDRQQIEQALAPARTAKPTRNSL